MTELERVAGVDREAPVALLQRLREVEPLAELAYVGEGKWWLGRREPNAELSKAGLEKVRVANTVAAVQKMTPEAVRMHRVGKLQQAGLVFIAEYEGEPDGRIVKDLEVMDFLWKLNATQQRWEKAMDADKNAEKELAMKDMLDEGRAHDAWRYAFTGSFSASRVKDSGYRSGRTTHTRIA
jgi:hypothetical protein